MQIKSLTKFENIANQIEEQINQGVYPVNSKLATQRELADEFQTTPVTISKAIKILIRRNKVRPVTGSGTFVLGEEALSQAIQASSDANHFNFSILQPCMGHNYPTIEERFQQMGQQVLSSSLMNYTENSGLTAHKAAGVAWCAKWGLNEQAIENYFLVNGAQQALSMLLLLCTAPGDSVLVEELTYPGLLAILKLLGRRAIPVALDEEGLIPENLKEVILQYQPKALVMTPTVQNPTTATMGLQRRQALVEIIQQHNLITIEDDLYAFLNESHTSCIADLAPEHVFYVTSLSKAISPGLRAGYIRTPEQWRNKLQHLLRAMNWLCPPLTFELATQLIESDEATKLAIDQRTIARQRQIICADIFNGFQYRASPTSFQLWLNLPDHWSSEQFILQANQKDIQVSSSTFFTVNQSTTNQIRVSLMAIDGENHLKTGLLKLRSLLNEQSIIF